MILSKINIRKSLITIFIAICIGIFASYSLYKFTLITLILITLMFFATILLFYRNFIIKGYKNTLPFTSTQVNLKIGLIGQSFLLGTLFIGEIAFRISWITISDIFILFQQSY